MRASARQQASTRDTESQASTSQTTDTPLNLDIIATPVRTPVVVVVEDQPAPKMPGYLNTNGEFNRSQASCLQYTTWYSVRDLMATIKSINKINFSIVEQRQQALTSLNSISDDCPYSLNTRFPQDGHYVCAGKGDWVRKIQQLRTSLAYKEVTLRGGPTPPAASTTDANDSCIAFYNACSAIITQVAQRDFVHDRQSFERDFALTWIS